MKQIINTITETITVKGIVDEDFVNYKVPSMTIMFPHCDFKCGSYCQNSSLANENDIEISVDALVQRFLTNDISEAIVCQGLEPFDSFCDLLSFISVLRESYNCENDVVIYTGYNKSEIEEEVNELSKFKNIIIKFGRYLPNQDYHFDEILGVNLASPNQYAERIS